MTVFMTPEIEAMGFDKMRSRITIQTTDGREIAGKADERYRGGPENPISDEELEDAGELAALLCPAEAAA